MKWFKKIVRAILALLPVFAVLFTSNVSALKYPITTFPIAPNYFAFRKIKASDTGDEYFVVFSKPRQFAILESSSPFPDGFEFGRTLHAHLLGQNRG